MKKYVSIFVFNPDGQFALLRRSRTAMWKPLHWNLPSGHIDADTLPIDAAVLELKEELNLLVKPAELIAQKVLDNGKALEHYFSFNANIEQVMGLTLNYEHDGIIWASPEVLPELTLVPDLAKVVRQVLIDPYLPKIEIEMLKAFNYLLNVNEIDDLDTLLKAGVAKGTHKKDNPDYEPVKKGDKIVGYRKKGTPEGSPKKAGHADLVKQSAVHPVGSKVAFKSKGGELISGQVVKHGNDHGDFGKLIHIRTPEGKEYTRYAHNVKGTEAPTPTEPKKAEKGESKPSKGEPTSNPDVHPVGTKVTLKNKKGERVSGEVIKHGEDHGKKGQLIHIKTDHGTYVRYHHNTSRVETGEVATKAKEPEKKVEKPAPKPKVEKPKKEPEVKKDNELLNVGEVAKRITNVNGTTAYLPEGMKNWKEYAEKMTQLYNEAKDDATKGTIIEAMKVRMRFARKGNGMIDLKAVVAAKNELEGKLHGILDKAPSELTPSQRANLLSKPHKINYSVLASHTSHLKDAVTRLKKQLENLTKSNAPSEKLEALRIRCNTAGIRSRRMQKKLNDYLDNPTDEIQQVPAKITNDDFEQRKKRFLYHNSPTRDKNLNSIEGKLMPNFIFDNITHLPNIQRGVTDQNVNYNPMNNSVNVNANIWGGDNDKVVSHEYWHHVHMNMDLVHNYHIDPYFKDVFSTMEKEWGELKKANPMATWFGSNQREMGNFLRQKGMKDTRPWHCGMVTDCIGAITRGKDGQGHSTEYYNHGSIRANAHMEVFVHFAQAYTNGHDGLKLLFPNTYAKAMQYFDDAFVFQDDKK
jgi:8-oxo-dGTP pyrophosphatase MutT (NUDIX family)